MPADRNEIADLLAQLHEGLTERTPARKEMRRELEEQGIDVERTVAEGLRLIDESKKRRRLKLARRRLDRLRDAVAGWSGVVEQSIDRMKEDIARAFAGEEDEVAYQAYYRKLSTVDRADLESLNEDEALIELIAKIETEEQE